MTTLAGLALANRARRVCDARPNGYEETCTVAAVKTSMAIPVQSTNAKTWYSEFVVPLVSHLSALERQALTEFATGVRAAFAGRAISLVLFGSRARGTARDDSDFDVFVLLSGTTRKDKHVLYDLAFDVGLEHRLTLSPLVGSIDTWPPDLPIARAIERDGIPL